MQILNTLYTFSNLKCQKVKSLSHAQLFATPWTVAYQAPPSVGFSRQECWSGLPFPSPGNHPVPGIEPWSPTLQADALPSEPPGKTIKHQLIEKVSHKITTELFTEVQNCNEMICKVLTFVKVHIINHPLNSNDQRSGRNFFFLSILNIRERLGIMRESEKQQLLPFMLG